MAAVVLQMMFVMPAAAQLPQPGRNAISAFLTPEMQSVAPGQTVTLALTMRPEPGWHGYWKNPGDAGVETRIKWDLPQGVAAGPIQYPVPGRLTIAGIMNYVYESEYTHLIDLRIPPSLAAGTRLPVRGRMNYLACTDEICVPESADIATDLIVGATDRKAKRNTAFDAYREKLPKPLGSEARFERAGGRLRLAIPLPSSFALADPYFFPLTLDTINHSAPQSISRNGDMLIVETAASTQAGLPAAIEGVLRFAPDRGLSLNAVRGDVPPAGDPVGAGDLGGGSGVTLLVALAGALIGGLLLNVMPCVFPILSLKALSLAKAGGDEAKARKEALAYAGGVILVCLLLGGVLLSLRAGGATVGWAFQLQDPRVILFLLLLITAISLNLAGLFELPVLGMGDRLSKSAGASGAFWTGALAAFVATPCTGPFMGAALGAALILPPAAAMAVFAGLGLGIALPFLMLGFIPALRRRIPKPGAWMGRLRHILSIPMFLTALGLAWVLGRQTGVDGMTLGLGVALILALGLWWVGRRQQGHIRAWLPLIPAGAAMLAAIFLLPASSAPALPQMQSVLPSEPFSEARLSALRAEGRPVFVYFTADWCITCKINEKGALERSEVAESFAEQNILVLAGDWTRGDAAIGRFLAEHGRSGVPLYLYYAPGKDAEILPQLLTPRLLKSLRE